MTILYVFLWLVGVPVLYWLFTPRDGAAERALQRREDRADAVAYLRYREISAELEMDEAIQELSERGV